MRRSFADALADPRRIDRQIDRIARRSDARLLEGLTQEGVRFADIVADRERFVKLLSRSLGDASFRPGIARTSVAFIAGKWRTLARLGAIDLLAHAVVGEVVGELLEPLLSPRVYSYRAKRSSWQALRLLARVARAHVAARPDPRTRGLYVLRTDIQSYAPSIPLGPSSPLWPQLRELTGLAESSPHWAMLEAIVLQPQVDRDGDPVSRERGVLFGSPSSNALMNMFLMPLDEALDAVSGVYTRFGDDILFLHEDPDHVRHAREIIETTVEERGLLMNDAKLHVVYWNAAARPSEVWPEAKPMAKMPFLGAAIHFDGTIALSPAKWKIVLLDLRERIRGTARLLDGDPQEQKARILAEVVNAAFEPRTELALSHENMLRELVSDRSQLRELDYLLALWIAEAVSGHRGVRAFREVPYRWLREEAGLRSRVVVRNGARR